MKLVSLQPFQDQPLLHQRPAAVCLYQAGAKNTLIVLRLEALGVNPICLCVEKKESRFGISRSGRFEQRNDTVCTSLSSFAIITAVDGSDHRDLLGSW